MILKLNPLFLHLKQVLSFTLSLQYHCVPSIFFLNIICEIEKSATAFKETFYFTFIVECLVSGSSLSCSIRTKLYSSTAHSVGR